MAKLDTATRRWVRDTLNVPLAAAGSSASHTDSALEPDNSFPASSTKAFDQWQSAIEAVDGQISTLQSALRSSETPVLKCIGVRPQRPHRQPQVARIAATDTIPSALPSPSPPP